MKFLLNDVLCREVFDNSGVREGCYNFANREVTECQDCEYRMNCPADGDDEMLDAEARESQDVREMHSAADGEEDV